MVEAKRYDNPLIVVSRLNRIGKLFDVVSVLVSETGTHILTICTAFHGSGMAVGEWRKGRDGGYGFFSSDIPCKTEFSYFCDLFKLDRERFPMETAIMVDRMYAEILDEIKNKLAINFADRGCGKMAAMRGLNGIKGRNN